MFFGSHSGFQAAKLWIQGNFFEEETSYAVSSEWCLVCYYWSSSIPTSVLRFNSNVSSYLTMFLLTEKNCFLFFGFFPACFLLIIVSDPCLDARPFHSFKRCICPMIPVLLVVASEW